MQQRSRRRYDAIIDAAAIAFAEQGFDATTMEAIAVRAHTSIGSLYQFFPNKAALFDAMAERCLARSREMFAHLFAVVTPSTPWTVILDGAVDALAELHASDPAFRAAMVNFSLYPTFEQREDALKADMVTIVSHLIASRAPRMERSRAATLAGVIVQLITAMIFYADRGGSSQRAVLLEETKTVLRRYLEPELVTKTSRARSARTRLPTRHR